MTQAAASFKSGKGPYAKKTDLDSRVETIRDELRLIETANERNERVRKTYCDTS
jgi:hypothetical protein